MRCENCGELLKEPELQTLDKTEHGKIHTEKTLVWTCGNCGQTYNKIEIV